MIKIIFIFFVLGVFFIIKFKIKNMKKNNKNTDVSSIQLIINSILYKDLDIVRISELISEENLENN